MTPVLLAARNLSRNPRRTMLTGSVIVIGFAAVALAGGFMAQNLEGLREGTIRNGLGHLQIADARLFADVERETLEHGMDGIETIERIVRADGDVEALLPRTEFVGLVTMGGASFPCLGVGLDPVRESRSMDLPAAVMAGRWLADRRESAAVLGSGLAKAMRVEVGDVVTILATTRDGVLNAVDLPVVGIVAIPIKDLDDRFLATTLEAADVLLAAGGRVSKLVVMLRDADLAAAAKSRLVDALRSEGVEAAARTWDELAVFYRQVRLLYIGIFGFMGAVLVTVVLFAVANTMYMITTERTREIATLRALGTRPAAIRRLFVAEAATLGVLGCLLGAVLSLCVRALLNRSGIVLPPAPGASHGTPLHVKVYVAAYVGGAVLMLAAVVATSYVAARRASRLSIVDGLSHV